MNENTQPIAANADKIREAVEQSEAKERLLRIRPANDCITDAKKLPELKPLFFDIWYQTQVAILFADSGIGKTLLATQIADSITQGKAILESEFKPTPQPVLFIDFELSDRQFEKRYGSYSFAPTFHRADINPDFLDYHEKDFGKLIIEQIKVALDKTKASVLMIDNITWLKTQGTQDSQTALDLMRELTLLKRQRNLSLLVLAHTPKRSQFNPISQNDLSGSKHLANFADTMFAINKSTMDSKFRYIKHTKIRDSEGRFDESNVMTCEIGTDQYGLLGYQLRGYHTEAEHLEASDTERKEDKKQLAKELRTQGKSLREIAHQLGVGSTTVKRWCDE